MSDDFPLTQTLVTLSLPDPTRTFVDFVGLTHDALETNHRIGTLSLCGQPRCPIPVKEPPSQIQAFANTEAPEGVDCMTCLTRRARLDVEIARERAIGVVIGATIELNLAITSWA